ncbi:CapA family protein [Vibrio breoganii]
MIVNFFGDLNLNQRNTNLSFSNRLNDLMNSGSFNVVNLEGPIIRNQSEYSQAFKSGPNIYNTGNVLELLQKMKVKVVSLSNNHTMDYGEKCARATIEELNKIGITSCGYAIDNKNKSSYSIVSENGLELCFVSVSEIEWGGATDTRPGVKSFCIEDLAADITSLSSIYDGVVVLFHGGLEYSSVPSLKMVKQLRYIADCGAKLIVCHHTHVINGFENWNGTPIYYGLGNFIFEGKDKGHAWRQGIIVNAFFDEHANVSVKTYIAESDKSYSSVDLLPFDNLIYNRFEKLSENFNCDLVISSKWAEHNDTQKHLNISTISPLNAIGNRYLRYFLKILGFNRFIFTKRYIAFLLVILRNESIRASIIHTLEKELGNDNENSTRK